MLGSQVFYGASASPRAMYDASYKSWQSHTDILVDSPVKTLFSFLILLLTLHILWTIYLDRKIIPGFPIVGQYGLWDILRSKARYRFLQESHTVVKEGQAQYGEDAVFQVTGHSGPCLVVPISLMNEVRGSPDLSQPIALTQGLFGEYETFHSSVEAIKDHLVDDTIIRKLNRSLTLITDSINEEINIAAKKSWPASTVWKESLFVEEIKSLSAQMSARVFVGLPTCRDERWLGITKQYTMDLLIAGYSMQYSPRLLRPIVHRFSPGVKSLSKTIGEAGSIIKPLIEQRKEETDALARGEKRSRRAPDSLDWMLELAESSGRNHDITSSQLILSFAAVHALAATIAHLMYDIIEYDLADELRQEVISTYRQEGSWSKATLNKLKLLDSIMKESSRLHTLLAITIQRYAVNDVVLSNGITIPKGVRFITPNFHHTSDDRWKDATTFDSKRFLRMREQPGNAHKHQYVAPTAEHVAFGLGLMACPGRFFSGHVMKLMMAHLLLNYDWKFVDKRPPYAPSSAGSHTVEPSVPILYRSRTPEIAF